MYNIIKIKEMIYLSELTLKNPAVEHIFNRYAVGDRQRKNLEAKHDVRACRDVGGQLKNQFLRRSRY